MQFLSHRLGPLQAHLQSPLSAQHLGIGLDAVQSGDALDGLLGYLAGVGLDQLVELPARVSLISSSR